MKGLLAAAVSISLLAVATDRAVAECKLVSAVIPVTMEGLRPMISAQINGIDEKASPCCTARLTRTLLQ
jgi:hypothetical protein